MVSKDLDTNGCSGGSVKASEVFVDSAWTELFIAIPAIVANPSFSVLRRLT